MDKPTVSVIMSVYNGEKYLEEAMDSLLGQSFTDWECIVVNDCSSDRTAEILESYARRDSRVRVLSNQENLRLPASLNRALSQAQGKYLVRMDADDVCRKDRLEKQVAFMEKHPKLLVSSCRFFTLQGDKATPAALQRRGSSDMVRGLFLFFNPILHPGVIARRNPELFWYDTACTCTEDFDLWIRLLCEGQRLAIQDDYLMLYRIHENQVTATQSTAQREQYLRIIGKYYEKFLFPLDEEQKDFLMKGIYYRDMLDEHAYSRFIRKVHRANKKKGSFSAASVEYAAFEILMAYRSEFNLDKIRLLWLLKMFSFRFVVNEIIRRKRAAKKAALDYQTAAGLFGLKPYDQTGPVPVYQR